MRILITGAGGFLGSAVCEKLSQNHILLALSRNFDKLCLNSNIFCQNSEMAQYHKLSNLFEQFSPDIVIHCSWIGGSSFSDTEALSQTQNISYSVDLLNLCVKYKIKHFIGFGSSSEFGQQDKIFDEKTVCAPQSLYGISKYSFQLISENYCKKNSISYSWVRPVFTYGPKDVTNRIIPKSIISFLRNEKLVLNECSSIVDYLYVDDFADAIFQIVENTLLGDFIICSDGQVQVRELVTSLYKILKPNSELIFDSKLNDTGNKYVCGTSQKLKSLSNWSPKVNLDEGLRKTIEYFSKLV